MISRAVRMHLISLKRSSGPADAHLEGREELGGKAQGLLALSQVLAEMNAADYPEINLDIPAMSVLGTSIFDAFMLRSGLDQVDFSRLSDARIAHAFQRADLPFEILGELHALINRWSMPLAIRSSGLLEDTMHRPFAGVYGTKMIPNIVPNQDIRFQKLVEAIKFVWASTYFKISRDYCQATGLDIREEKMAVVIQQIVGKRHSDRFYPELSGVARSFNFYPLKPARPEDGVVSLALGMGKTIVDGGRSWTYSPAFPHMPPPFGSIDDLLNQTQTDFWAVNLGEPPEYDPIRETEYLCKADLRTADNDGTLQYLASTYDVQSERLTPGTGGRGPRALNFSPLLDLDQIPFNRLVTELLAQCEEKLRCAVEIEFAMTFEPHYFGCLQVRPMAVPDGDLRISIEDLTDERAVAASEAVLGNGTFEGIEDVIYVIPQHFDLQYTRQVAQELEEANHRLLAQQRPYLLIVFGRLGTLDPWLGIPVTWGQISGAKVIVEAAQENVRVEPSQGSHYFHNIINLGVIYFTVPYSSPYPIDWAWLENQAVLHEGSFVRHIRLNTTLEVKVDGRDGRGVIYRSERKSE
jgi:hypothetical protein